MRHEFRSGCHDDRGVGWVRRDTHAPRPGPERRFTGQPHGTWHSFATANDQHVPEITFVRSFGARPQCLGQQFVVDPTVNGVNIIAIGVGNLEPGKTNGTAMAGRISKEQA